MPVPILPIALGGLAFLNWLNQRSAGNTAADRQSAALDKAQGAITEGKDKALELFKPYMQNAGQDFNQMRGLVQGGFFQQPSGAKFTPQQFQQSGFNFNPSQGSASFQPWQGGGLMGSQQQALPGLPPMAQGPAQQQPPAQGGGMVRNNAMPVPMEEYIRAGMQSVTPQNRPGLVPQGGVMNPVEENIQRGQAPAQNGGSPYTPPGPMTMQQLWASGLVNRYGSGTFIPTTYGRR